ncbi:unnamed protein product [Caenorhabditis brenneri]
MDSFGIVFDSPNGYTPGQAVTGQVVLRSCEAISARYLKICIHGAAHTKWSESEHRHRDCNGSDESYTEIVNYSAEMNYVSGETVAWTARNGMEKLPSGHHVFPFSFPLPIDCPPSYEGFHGHIRYSIRVELDRPWKFNKKEREYFNVIPNFDLNYLPYGNMPIVMKDSKDIGAIFKKGLVIINVSIPKQAYASGEYLPITIDIDNTSKRPATCVRAELHQHSHYNASRNAGLFCTHSSYHEHHKDETKRVSETRKNVKVAAKSQGREELRMKIPKLAPSFQSPLIGVEYCLSVKVDTETSLNNTLHVEFPIIIGTVPINSAQTIPEVVPTAPILLAEPEPSSIQMIPVFPSARPVSTVYPPAVPDTDYSLIPTIPVFPSARPTSTAYPVVPETNSSSIATIPVFPSAPQQFGRTDSLPPAYSGPAPSAPADVDESSFGQPPSYEESMSVTKI